MIWCRFQSGQKVSFGIVEGDVVTEVSGSPFDEHKVTATTFQLSQVKLLAPRSEEHTSELQSRTNLVCRLLLEKKKKKKQGKNIHGTQIRIQH